MNVRVRNRSRHAINHQCKNAYALDNKLLNVQVSPLLHLLSVDLALARPALLVDEDPAPSIAVP